MGNKEVFFFGYGSECNYFAIDVFKKSDSQAVANVFVLDEKYQDFDPADLTNGDKVMAFVDSDDIIINIDVWSKYYFPTFSEEQRQWYHKICETDTDYMDMFHAVMKFAYSLAIKEIKIY